jgi:WD40 repeat protein
VRSLDFSPDGRHLAAAGITDVSNAFAGIGVPAVVLIDFVSGKPLRVQKPKENIQGSVFSLRFHPSGEFYVAAGGGPAGALWFFKLEDEKSFFDFKLPSVAYDMSLHPDGVRLVVGLFDKTLRVYDLGPKLEVAATK